MNITTLRPLGRPLSVVAAMTLYATRLDSAARASGQFGPTKVQAAWSEAAVHPRASAITLRFDGA